MTPQAEKKRLLEKYYQGKKKAKVGRSADVRQSSLVDGRCEVLLNYNVDAMALGDYGADDLDLPRSLVEHLQRSGKQIPTLQFDEPIELSPAVKQDSPLITAPSKWLFNTTVCLTWGALRVRKVKALIVDQNMDELLLGFPLLNCLVFNLDAQL